MAASLDASPPQATNTRTTGTSATDVPATGPGDSPAELAGRLDSTDPAVGLRAVAALGRLLEQIEALQVAGARRQGWSWQDIAEALGVTKQTVHRKHSTRTRR